MTRPAELILDQEFLQTRAKILEIAAFFDRVEAAQQAGSSTDERHQQQLELLRQGSGILIDGEGDKAARLQLLFSREYQSQWRQEFDL